jgi:hypothetical protein
MRSPAMIVIVLAALGACGSETPAATATVEAPAPSAAAKPAPAEPAATPEELAALSSCGVVTAEGYCGVTFGMAPDAAKEKFPVKLEVYAGEDVKDDPNQCFELFATEPVDGVSFLVEQAKVGRIDVMSGGPRTADNFGVGTPGDAIRQKFGAAVTEHPNKYEPEITDLSVMQGAAKFVFELQDGTVRAWRAGPAPTIDYVEHCG